MGSKFLSFTVCIDQVEQIWRPFYEALDQKSVSHSSSLRENLKAIQCRQVKEDPNTFS
ncbi:hypothetical protein IC582_025218 [Cucumis melo]